MSRSTSVARTARLIVMIAKMASSGAIFWATRARPASRSRERVTDRRPDPNFFKRR